MVKKNTIIMSCEKYIKKLSYAYTGKLLPAVREII